MQLFPLMMAEGREAREEFVVATWYADHERRPLRGASRNVHLSRDATTWFHDLIMAWDEWVDPF